MLFYSIVSRSTFLSVPEQVQKFERVSFVTTIRMPFGILYCWPQIVDCGELVVCCHRKFK